MIISCEQRSAEWLAVRLGKVTGSRVADVMTKRKSGEAASRRNYRAELVAEIITGRSVQGFISNEMRWGIEQESAAREAYTAKTGNAVEIVGFAVHSGIPRFGASPDGLVGDNGLVEIKCLNTANHIDCLLSGEIPTEYQWQMTAELACTNRAWCDFVAFDPRMGSKHELFIKTFERSAAKVEEMEAEIIIFLNELDEMVDTLRALEVE